MENNLASHPLADFFNRLTPEQLFAAVEAIGERCTGRFLILNSYENRVYQFELENGKYVVGKFYRPGRWDRSTIQAEHSFTQQLAEAEIAVATPLPLNGRPETIGETTGIMYAVFERIGGRSPDELRDEQVQILGRLIARIHNVSTLQNLTGRRQLTCQTYGRENLDYLLSSDAIPEEARQPYAATVEALLSRMTPLFADVPTHLIHGDCHLGNLIWSQAGPTFLDFDDAVIGPAVQDIWMMVPSYDAEGQRQRRVMINAYREFRDFQDSWLRLVEPLRALRFIHYSAWIARRWNDPIFQRTFNYFGTVQYWQREIADLREQIARMDMELM